MNKALKWIVLIAVCMLLYIPCRVYAKEHRATEAIGGEILVPVAFIAAASAWEATENEEDKN